VIQGAYELDLKECKDLMKEFIADKPQEWFEDIGEISKPSESNVDQAI
jgi:hypothetical protein